MLIPQFSLRALLLATTALALVSLVASFAFQGSTWAMAIMAALSVLAAMFLLQAAAYQLVWLPARLRSKVISPAGEAHAAPVRRQLDGGAIASDPVTRADG